MPSPRQGPSFGMLQTFIVLEPLPSCYDPVYAHERELMEAEVVIKVLEKAYTGL